MKSCDNCKCPDVCMKWPIFCQMAADKDNPNYEININHICNRSQMNINRVLPNVVVMGEGGSVHAVSTGYPSFVQQVLNVASAAGRVIGAVAHQQRVIVPKEVYESRIEICKSCEQFDKSSMFPRCRICGCSTNGKLSLATEQCPHPDGPKWGTWEQLSSKP